MDLNQYYVLPVTLGGRASPFTAVSVRILNSSLLYMSLRKHYEVAREIWECAANMLKNFPIAAIKQKIGSTVARRLTLTHSLFIIY